MFVFANASDKNLSTRTLLTPNTPTVFALVRLLGNFKSGRLPIETAGRAVREA